MAASRRCDRKIDRIISWLNKESGSWHYTKIDFIKDVFPKHDGKISMCFFRYYYYYYYYLLPSKLQVYTFIDKRKYK